VVPNILLVICLSVLCVARVATLLSCLFPRRPPSAPPYAKPVEVSADGATWPLTGGPSASASLSFARGRVLGRARDVFVALFDLIDVALVAAALGLLMRYNYTVMPSLRLHGDPQVPAAHIVCRPLSLPATPLPACLIIFQA
jgi:hypothetical protein